MALQERKRDLFARVIDDDSGAGLRCADRRGPAPGEPRHLSRPAGPWLVPLRAAWRRMPWILARPSRPLRPVPRVASNTHCDREVGMDAATILRPLVDATIGTELPVRVDCWDGEVRWAPDRRGGRPVQVAPGAAAAGLGSQRARLRPGLRLGRRRDRGRPPRRADSARCPGRPGPGPRCADRARDEGRGGQGRRAPAGARPAPTPSGRGDPALGEQARARPGRQGGVPPLRRRQRLLRDRPRPVDGLLVRLLADVDGTPWKRPSTTSSTSSPEARPDRPGTRLLDVGCGWGSHGRARRPRARRARRRRHPLAGAGRVRP